MFQEQEKNEGIEFAAYMIPCISGGEIQYRYTFCIDVMINIQDEVKYAEISGFSPSVVNDVVVCS